MFRKKKQLMAIVEALHRELAEKEVSLELAELGRKAAQGRYTQKLEEANKVIDELLPKLIEVTARRLGPDVPGYRIAVDFHTDMIREMMIHGDSKEWIHYMAERIGHEIERELVTINFVRLREAR